MKCKILFGVCLMWLCAWGNAQTVEMKQSLIEGNPIQMNLWEQGVPSSNGMGDDKNITNIRVYLPTSETPTKAVVICPGGGYANLAVYYEGMWWRDIFNHENIAVIVLCYRMPYGHHEIPASDVYEAIRVIKAHSREWNIDPDNIGVMGFSAGGHLASTVATHAQENVRPAFQILYYPVITMDDAYTHKGSKYNLLGQDPDEALVKLYSNELQVTSHTPKALLMLADDDKVVVPMNSVLYYQALKENNVPASMYIYPSGGHGFGMLHSFKYLPEMLQDLRAWLRTL